MNINAALTNAYGNQLRTMNHEQCFKTNPIKANGKIGKMYATFSITRTYANELRTMNYELLPKTNPIKPNLETAPNPHLARIVTDYRMKQTCLVCCSTLSFNSAKMARRTGNAKPANAQTREHNCCTQKHNLLLYKGLNAPSPRESPRWHTFCRFRRRNIVCVDGLRTRKATKGVQLWLKSLE
jgi:hypothetical protein